MKLSYIKFYFLSMYMLASLVIHAQRNAEKADRYFNQNQFEAAIKYYTIEANSDNKKAKEYAMAKLADCYRIIGEFEKAEEIYRKILKRKSKEPKNFLNYALSLKSSAKYAEAKLQFEEYIKLKPEDPMGKIYLQSCDSAQKWLDETIGKEVKNIEQVNTEYSDFGTSILDNQLYFSSSRVGGTEALISFDGGGDMHRMDLYSISLSKLSSKETTAKDIANIKTVNTPMHEGTPTFSTDGQEMYFSRTIKGKRNEKTNNVLNTLQVFYTSKDSLGVWKTPISAFTFNSSEYSVAHPCLTKDGKRIYFMSDMPGGYGKTDIYYSDKNADGTWAKPKNVGNKVNTFGHELFPTITSNNELYFSSNAHPGMGQLDVFKAVLVDNVWDNVQNVKPPINSIGNDFGISFDETNEIGFVSSDRFNGKGLEDIYSFAFDVPLRIIIENDTVHLKNNFVFDDTKFKLNNLNDSTSEDLPVDVASNKLNMTANKRYALVAKKNGMPIATIELERKTAEDGKNYFMILSTDVQVKLLVKTNGQDDKIKLVSPNGTEEGLKLNENQYYESLKLLDPQVEYKLFR